MPAGRRPGTRGTEPHRPYRSRGQRLRRLPLEIHVAKRGGALLASTQPQNYLLNVPSASLLIQKHLLSQAGIVENIKILRLVTHFRKQDLDHVPQVIAQMSVASCDQNSGNGGLSEASAGH